MRILIWIEEHNWFEWKTTYLHADRLEQQAFVP